MNPVHAGATTILIADDDPDLRDILRSILEPAGFAVVEVADGARAIEAIRAKPPDLVILDYLMPQMTGPQVCQLLKQDLLLRHLPIIMLTGKSEVEDKVEGLNAGADDYRLVSVLGLFAYDSRPGGLRLITLPVPSMSAFSQNTGNSPNADPTAPKALSRARIHLSNTDRC